eukprot:GEZU01020035.1.p2 GENE.GEZU01020035.1~~GEZU01020035.1.p2  ORF type:complete len:111 (-),score=28.84 GEZU01020035.1:61-393(-)
MSTLLLFQLSVFSFFMLRVMHTRDHASKFDFYTLLAQIAVLGLLPIATLIYAVYLYQYVFSPREFHLGKKFSSEATDFDLVKFERAYLPAFVLMEEDRRRMEHVVAAHEV